MDQQHYNLKRTIRDTAAILIDHAESRSVLDDNSDGENGEGYIDRSSSLSIPNESIDFDRVYFLHSFAATELRAKQLL